jgi:tryptophanase
MKSELNNNFRKIARDFKGRIELMKKIPLKTSTSLFFELCNFNLNNYIKIEKERYPDKTINDIIIKMYKIKNK